MRSRLLVGRVRLPTAPAKLIADKAFLSLRGCCANFDMPLFADGLLFESCYRNLGHQLQGATTGLKRLLDKVYGSEPSLIKGFFIANKTKHFLYP